METLKILVRNRNLEEKLKRVSSWKVSSKEKEFVLKFVKDYENGKVTGRIGNNVNSSLDRILDYLKMSLQEINKDNPTEKDMENFFNSLLKDKIKGFNHKTGKYDGKPYSMRGKKACIDYLKKYIKWKFPSKPLLLSPLSIKISSKKKEPPYLRLDEIDKLYKFCRDEKQRYFISVLFSSGARAEEFHNLRYSDFELPKGDESFVKITIRNKFSKTEGRTISLYYNPCLEAVREYLAIRVKEGIKPEDPVLKETYWSMKNWLINFSKGAIGKPIYYHLFRHSSATWLANRLNRQQMCIYFGWKFSSPMPDVYINRKGVNLKDVDEKFKSTQLEEIKNKLDKREYDDKLKNEKMDNLEEDFNVNLEVSKILVERELNIIPKEESDKKLNALAKKINMQLKK